MYRKLAIIFNILMVLLLLSYFSGVDSYFTAPIYSSYEITNRGASPEFVENIEENFYRIPTKLVESFYKDGWTLILTNKLEGLENDPYENVAAGVTFVGQKSIQIKEINNDGLEVETLIHEFGHYYDYKLNYPSSSEEFISIFDKYHEDFIEYQYLNYLGEEADDYHYYNKETNTEFFATLYKEFTLYPVYLKEQIPEAYDFFIDLESDFNNLK